MRRSTGEKHLVRECVEKAFAYLAAASNDVVQV